MEPERGADLELMVAAALAAGAATMRSFGAEMEVTLKSPDQPLTAADLEANRILRERLSGARPAYGWLSEESVDDPTRLGRRRVWVIDPIDGTRSFIAGRREFAVSVGLAEQGAAVLGVVYNPASGELYWAARDGGAWKARAPVGWAGSPSDAGEPGGFSNAGPGALPVADRLHVRTGSTIDQRVLLASRSELKRGEFDPFLGEWRVEPLGSTAFKMAKVAEGVGDVFLSRGPKSEWDVCAAGLLVEEAGGMATDLSGEPFRYNRPDPAVAGVLATNGELHRYILGVVETLPPISRSGSAPSAPRPPATHDEGDDR